MILMYHHVAPRSAVPASADPADGWDFVHSPAAFAHHLDALLRRGFRFTSLDELVRSIRDTGREPARSVQITFDDGWSDNHRHAFPLLRERGLTATFFVATGHLAESRPDPRWMDAIQLRELADAGMTIGSHTRSHAILTQLAPAAAADEIAASRADLEQHLDRAVRHFAYPGGAFDAGVAKLVREAGYASACSVLGPAENDPSSLYWLFRDVLSESMTTLSDRYRCSPLARRLLSFRVRRRLRAQLATA